MKLNELIDKKILYVNYPINRHTVIEGKVKEISPTNKCIKIDNDWYLVDNIRIIELFSEKERPGLTFKCNND